MDGLLYALVVLLAAGASAALSYALVRRTTRAQLEGEQQLWRERAAVAQREREAVTVQLERARTELADLHELLRRAREDGVRLEAQLKSERDAGSEKLLLIGQARETLSAQFRALANEIFEERGKKLSEQSRGELDLLLRPLGEKLMSFEKKVEETYHNEAKERHSLADEVRKLHTANQRISEEALNLTRALKGESKTRGNWGEVILERVLERSGLTRGTEYEVQATLNEGGARLRPDVIVHLPEKRHIVIDSKVSLVAYDRYFSAPDDAARADALRELLGALRAHINDLASKNYQGNAALDAPDFVAMFVPIEPAFNLAAGSDEGLYLDAFEKRVVIVTPGTLLAMMSTVSTLWRRDKQNRNVLEIAKRSGELYDKFKDFVDALTEIGERIEAAHQAYETAHKRLATGKGNLVRRVEDLRVLGARAEKELPASLIDQASHGYASDRVSGEADTDATDGVQGRLDAPGL